MIRITCEHCQKQLKAPDDYAGKDGQCPSCHNTLKIPKVQTAEATITPPAVSSTLGLSTTGIAAFVSELATYYMDFLETDFHKMGVPKRSVRFRNSKNLRVGLDLAKYGAFQSSVLKVLARGIAEPLSIPREKYLAFVSQKARDLIAKHTTSISDEVLAEVAESISTKITDLANPKTTGIGDALSGSLDSATDTIRTKIVTPFVTNVEGLLHGNTGENIDLIYCLEEDLVEILMEPLDGLISEWVGNVYGGQPEDIAHQIRQVLDGAFVRDSIKLYFSSFSENDLFFEIQELVDNNLILDKQDLYLYICDIGFEKNK